MRKKIVKALLLIPATLVLLLSTLALSGCHDDNDDVNMVDFYGKEVPCHLMSVDDMPEWLQKLVKKGEALEVFLGSYEEEKVYHVKWTWSSSSSGQIFDSDGVGLEVPRDAVSNWICIYTYAF